MGAAKALTCANDFLTSDMTDFCTTFDRCNQRMTSSKSLHSIKVCIYASKTACIHTCHNPSKDLAVLCAACSTLK